MYFVGWAGVLLQPRNERSGSREIFLSRVALTAESVSHSLESPYLGDGDVANRSESCRCHRHFDENRYGRRFPVHGSALSPQREISDNPRVLSGKSYEYENLEFVIIGGTFTDNFSLPILCFSGRVDRLKR